VAYQTLMVQRLESILEMGNAVLLDIRDERSYQQAHSAPMTMVEDTGGVTALQTH